MVKVGLLRVALRKAGISSDRFIELLGARYYLPSLGRFITEDPIGFAGGLNPYLYCENDPVNLSDPAGLHPSILDDVHDWVGTWWAGSHWSSANWELIRSSLAGAGHGTLSDPPGPWSEFWAGAGEGAYISFDAVNPLGDPCADLGMYNAGRWYVPWSRGLAITGGVAGLGAGALSIAGGAGVAAGAGLPALQFSKTVLTRTDPNPDRFVPLRILQWAVQTGVRLPDRISGAFQYYCPMWKNGRLFTLKVVVREADQMVLHYHYETPKPLP